MINNDSNLVVVDGFIVAAVTPNDNDILCGRGRKEFEHPGNQRLRMMIAKNLDKYSSCGHRSKGRTEIIRSIIYDILMKQHGRFLKYDRITKIWYDGGLELAKTRVSTAFRDARIPNKNKCMEALKRKASCKNDNNNNNNNNNSSGSSTSRAVDVRREGHHHQSIQNNSNDKDNDKKDVSRDTISKLVSHLMTTDLIPSPLTEEDEDKRSTATDSLLSRIDDDDDDNDIDDDLSECNIESIFDDDDDKISFDIDELFSISSSSSSSKKVLNHRTKKDRNRMNSTKKEKEDRTKSTTKMTLDNATITNKNEEEKDPYLGEIITMNARGA